MQGNIYRKSSLSVEKWQNRGWWFPPPLADCVRILTLALLGLIKRYLQSKLFPGVIFFKINMVFISGANENSGFSDKEQTNIIILMLLIWTKWTLKAKWIGCKMGMDVANTYAKILFAMIIKFVIFVSFYSTA